MAYIQPRTTDYPYKSWKLRCVGDNSAILDIETKRVTLSFELGPDYAMLIDKQDNEFKHLLNNKMSPGRLLLELSRCGLHLLPVDEDGAQGGINVKAIGSEERAILDIACCIRAFAFRSCKWNKTIEQENVVIKLRENLEFDREFFEDHEPDWRYVMYWPHKCAFVHGVGDNDSQPVPKIRPGTVTHSILHLTL